MSAPYRILFVCMGNICRSPAGENVLQHMLDGDDSIFCDSAGTIGYHKDDPPDRRMSAAAAKRGIRMRGSSRQIKPHDLDEFDLVLTMDEDNYFNVTALARSAEQSAKIRRFCDFCEEHPDKEVPDPYYGGHAGFEHVLDLLEDGCRQVLKHAREAQEKRT